MSSVETAHASISLLTNRHFRQLVAASPDKVAKRMATERVTTKQDCIHSKNDCAVTDSERRLASGASKPHRLPCIVQENNDEHQREVKKITMDVLQDERK